MILCGGMQCGGTTLASWCFLQRSDTDGVLDMRNDWILTSFERATKPVLWIKMTVGAFRYIDVYNTYLDLGWTPQTILVVRDVRAVFDSLLGKSYGFNGTTAEEPPLRIRLRRFLDDWRFFQDSGRPILKFEELVQNERGCLEAACGALGLDWDESMISWPKGLDDISYRGVPNETFRESITKQDRGSAILADRSRLNLERLPVSELDWLEETFADYNRVHGYPETVDRAIIAQTASEREPPKFEGTKRQRLAAELERLGRTAKMLYE